MSATIDIWTGRLGLLAGALAVAAWLALSGSPGDAAEPTASIRLGSLASGELHISQLEKPVVTSTSLRAGGRGARGALHVRNQTPRRLAFSLRTSSSQRDLDRAAWLEVSDGANTLLRAPLGRTRAWSAGKLSLASGESRELRVHVWIPADAPDSWQAGHGDVTLEFSSNPEETR